MADLELPVEVADTVASWSRIVNAATDKTIADILKKAACDLFRTRKRLMNGAELDAFINQVIVDALATWAESFGLDDDVSQQIFADAAFDAETPLLFEEHEIPYSNGRDQYPQAKSPEPLPYVDLIAPLVERAWLVKDCIPMFNVSLFSGEGAVGKSIALLQLSAAVVLAKDWFGMMPDFGPVLYIAAEDDDDELRRRIEAICAHYGTTRESLHQQGFRLLSYAGRDCTLARPDKVGMMEATPLLTRIREEALLLKPKLVVFDTVADMFGGYENDRTQTRQFITMVRGLAITVRCALIMASHPSVAGVRDDTGLSGSTAWHNSVRARVYFKTTKDDEDEETTKRVLEIRKNNYGPVSKAINVEWQDGVFVLPGTTNFMDKAAREAVADQVFVDLLRRLESEGRNVTDKPSVSYAPTCFAEQQEAKRSKLKAVDFRAAMERLFAAKKIRSVMDGPPSRQRSRLIIC